MSQKESNQSTSIESVIEPVEDCLQCVVVTDGGQEHAQTGEAQQPRATKVERLQRELTHQLF